MIHYTKHTLPNGLTLLFHKDETTPVGAFNIMYDVGAKDEHKAKTGFAHLFEHLMFGGSKHIPDFDKPLQQHGGVSNAFTSNDITNYYITIPKQNIETAFWLDSDRLLELAFTNKSLEVQRNVVIEEFKQRYLNQPYGDVWLLLRPLIYKAHPYKWATIGKEISHIENATLSDVKDFFYKHYTPQNAILCVAGNFEEKEILDLTYKWFGDIPSREKYIRHLPIEPEQDEYRELTVERNVPSTVIYRAYRMPKKQFNGNVDFYACDLITDILSRGKSARLHQKLVKEKELFSEVNAYISGETDGGCIIISAKLNSTTTLDNAHLAIDEVILNLINNGITEEELIKVKNKWISSKLFEDLNALNKAMNLCYFELLDSANAYNHEIDKYNSIQVDDIKKMAKKIFIKTNCSTLNYIAKI